MGGFPTETQDTGQTGVLFKFCYCCSGFMGFNQDDLVGQYLLDVYKIPYSKCYNWDPNDPLLIPGRNPSQTSLY